jgi:hypothetical protein
MNGMRDSLRGIDHVYTAEREELRMTEHDKAHAHPANAEIEQLMRSAAPGIETAIQTVEGAERVYFDAVMATTLPATVITSATTSSSSGAEVS